MHSTSSCRTRSGGSRTVGSSWVARALIQRDDRLRVVAGERFPADGRVISSTALVDEQALTGESRPIFKQPGDRVVGGTLNLDGDLQIAVTEVGETGTLARVVELVRVARESKGRYQRLADRVAGRFVPVVLAVAVAALGIHGALGSWERGLWAALAVALIACPCALGLAAPLAIWSAVGNAAGRRVLFRNGEALERLAEITAVRFDKTGTLTTGSPSVSEFVPENDSRAPAGAGTSRRPGGGFVARDVAGDRCDLRTPSMSSPVATFRGIRVVSGLGVTGTHRAAGDPIVLGSPRFLLDLSVGNGARLSRRRWNAPRRGGCR